ncbi:hypothetical protein BGX38DRAFT_373526 [Terfezia claveryi]|nr:hypothetical protein BGX38DRAFT_373526 [Terfezia claveryi]
MFNLISYIIPALYAISCFVPSFIYSISNFTYLGNYVLRCSPAGPGLRAPRETINRSRGKPGTYICYQFLEFFFPSSRNHLVVCKHLELFSFFRIQVLLESANNDGRHEHNNHRPRSWCLGGGPIILTRVEDSEKLKKLGRGSGESESERRVSEKDR